MSIKMMLQAWELQGLSATQKLVLLCLADHANDQGVCWPSMERVAARSDVTDRSARRLIRQLEEMGHVSVTEPGGGRGKTPVYHVHPNPDACVRVSEENPDTVSGFVEEETRTLVAETRTDGAETRTHGAQYPDTAVSAEPIEPPKEPPQEPKQRQRPRADEPEGEAGTSRRRRGLVLSLENEGGEGKGELRAIMESWEAAQFKMTPVVQEHLRKWLEKYGAAQVLEAIQVAGLDDPKYPGKYVAKILRNWREDQEAAEDLAERVELAVQAAREPREVVYALEEPEPVRLLREIARLREAEMALDGEVVRVKVRDVAVAENRMRYAVTNTLASGGLSQYQVEFIPGGLAA